MSYAERLYPGSGATDVRLFTIAQWAGFQEDLAVTDAVMRTLAWKYDMVVRTNVRDQWPSRELIGSRGVRVLELRLLLNSRFEENGDVHYELHEQWMIRLGWYQRLREHRIRGDYTRAGVRDIESLAHDIEALIVANGFAIVRDDNA